MHETPHRKNRSLRASARGNSSRPPALLRDVSIRRLELPRACWSKATRAGRPRSKGIRSIPEASAASDIFSQASILNFYDPDRSQSVIFDGRVSTWSDFAAAMGNARTRLAPAKGAGMRILTKTITSPTLGAQIKSLLAQFPEAKWHQYEACGGDSVREGARLAFGRPVNTVYHFDQADVIVSLDADFLTCGAGHVRYAREFASRRDLSAGPASKLNRLYVAESMPTSTGAVADHRLPVRSADIEDLARQLGGRCGRRRAAQRERQRENSGRLGRSRRARSGRASRIFDCDCGRAPAAVRSRARARHERGARQRRQDGRLHRIHRSESGQPARIAARSRERFECRQGRLPGDPRRQPGLRRAG